MDNVSQSPSDRLELANNILIALDSIRSHYTPVFPTDNLPYRVIGDSWSRRDEARKLLPDLETRQKSIQSVIDDFAMDEDIDRVIAAKHAIDGLIALVNS